MPNIIFVFNGIKSNFHCEKEDRIIDIFLKFISKNKIERSSTILIYNGKFLTNLNLTFNEQIDEIDKEKN